jgi:hypothetical protein
LREDGRASKQAEREPGDERQQRHLAFTDWDQPGG